MSLFTVAITVLSALPTVWSPVPMSASAPSEFRKFRSAISLHFCQQIREEVLVLKFLMRNDSSWQHAKRQTPKLVHQVVPIVTRHNYNTEFTKNVNVSVANGQVGSANIFSLIPQFFCRLHFAMPTANVNKKLSCRREAARRFVSFKTLLSHSKPPKIIWNYTDE